MTVALVALALIFITRWCVLRLYSETYVPVKSSELPEHTLIAPPVSEPAAPREIPYEAVKPPQEASVPSHR